MALLDSLFSPNASAPTPPPAPVQDGGGFLGGLMGPNGLVGPDLAPTVQAIGMSLLSSSRFNPLEKLPVYMKQAEDQRTQAASRGALVAVLKQAGFSDQEAQAYALNPKAAELAIATKATARGQAADKAALGILGGDLTSGASPVAPAGPAGGASLNGAAAPLTGSQTERARAVYDGLIQRGVSPMLAAGMTGNIGAESSFDPAAVGDDGSAYGYHQARGSRAANLRAIAQQKGVGWDNHDAQLDNIVSEFNGGDAGMVKAKRLIDADPNMTPQKAAAIIAQYGERPSAAALLSSMPRRAGGAAQAYNMFGQPQAAQVADASGATPALPAPTRPTQGADQPVQIASNENETQVLEGRMGMYPPNVYGVARPPAPQRNAVAAADLPAPGAQEAEFRIPGEGGSAGGDAPTVFNDRPTAMRVLGKINQALAVPGISDDTRRILEARRQEALSVLKPTDTQQKLAEMGLRPGTQEYQDAARRMAFGDKAKDPTDTVEGRKALAQEYGFQPGTPEYVNWVLGKRLPKDDEKKPMSVADRNAILKADEAVESAQGVLSNLHDAMALSKKAYDGPTASYRGAVTGFFGSEAGQATAQFDNIITATTLGQLKQIFGGNPTEGERKILLEIQGASSQPQPVREAIIKRAIAATERRRQVMQERADELRAGTYYQQGGGQVGGAARGQSGPPTGRPANAPTFSQDDLLAEARRRGLVQ